MSVTFYFKDYSTYQVILSYCTLASSYLECGSMQPKSYITAEGITQQDFKRITQYIKKWDKTAPEYKIHNA